MCKTRLQERLPGTSPAAALRTGAGTEMGIDPLGHWAWPGSLQAAMWYRLFGNYIHLIPKIGNICCCLPLWEASLVMPVVTRNFPLISGLGLLMASLHSDIFGSDCPSSWIVCLFPSCPPMVFIERNRKLSHPLLCWNSSHVLQDRLSVPHNFPGHLFTAPVPVWGLSENRANWNCIQYSRWSFASVFFTMLLALFPPLFHLIFTTVFDSTCIISSLEDLSLWYP